LGAAEQVAAAGSGEEGRGMAGGVRNRSVEAAVNGQESGELGQALLQSRLLCVLG